MDSKQFHRRVWGVVALLGCVMLIISATLYQVQIIDGESYLPSTAQTTTTYETVDAARGDIVDRYGRLLVTNTTSYQVTLDGKEMGDARNDTLTQLLEICTAQEISWADTLSISQSPSYIIGDTPYYTFTTDNPYYTTAPDVLDRPTRYLTRLGKLAVKLGWLENDPSNKNYYDTYLPTATELITMMAESYGFIQSGEGVTQEIRNLVGVQYELSVREEEIYFVDYIFAQDVDIKFISLVKEQSLPGITITPITTRQYETDYAAHLLGRVTLMDSDQWAYYSSLDVGYEMDDYVGKDGVEYVFEEYLRGTDGVLVTETTADGELVRQEWETEPVPGSNVALTIDLDLQKKVEDTLAEMIPLLSSEAVEGAACVILDVNSGETLAMASYPTYSLATYSQDFAENSANPLNPFNNRATMGQYAPGSTFKMVTAIAALEEGIVTPTTQIYDSGIYTYYTSYQPQCWYYRQYGALHGWQNASQAITNSCNYYMYEVGRLLGITRLGEYAALFGLGEKTGFELGESAGIMAGPEYTQSVGGTWYDGATLSVAIGQESSQFTPLQLANYIATLVNGGTRYSTHILKDVRAGDTLEIIYSSTPQVLSTVSIAEDNLNAVKEGMLGVTATSSVATYFSQLDVTVGAKTGSAQVTGQDEANAIFVAFAPYDDPQISIALVVEQGSSGSALAAITAEILDYYFTAQESRQQLTTENTLVR